VGKSEPLLFDTDHLGLNKYGSGDDHLYKKLVTQIENACAPSLLEQADKYIQEKIYTDERLKIERLSDEALPMKQCYINLTIVEQTTASAESVRGASQFSRYGRLALAGDNNLQIKLETLFEAREAYGAPQKAPRRLFIRGQPGVGKTTLSKKIVYEFYHSGLWENLFDRVLWVPLRNLQGRQGEVYTLKKLFRDEFFSREVRHKDLARELCMACERDYGRARTLFLLDGLDEIWHKLPRNGDMFRFVQSLLNQPNVIVTSRPTVGSVSDLDAFDLNLETVGFHPDQVKEYVNSIQHKNASEIQAYLDLHSFVGDLIRIPIQLDALCHVWEDFSQMPERIEDLTMTDLYNAIERSLWKKDAIRLSKTSDEEAELEHFMPNWRALENLVTGEMLVLEGLAFTGLYRGVAVFDKRFRDMIYMEFVPKQDLDSRLLKLSFIRSSGASTKNRDRTYYFLHLTYQEYFAAKYFVRRWMEHGSKLICCDPRTGEVEQCAPATFLRRWKYSARLNIFWRFVAGLLSQTKAHKSGELQRFFELIQQEPVDILGPAHQRLTMYCLDEVRYREEFPLGAPLRALLSKWVIFQCKNRVRVSLAREIELPEVILLDILANEAEDIKEPLISSLQGRRMLSPKLIEALRLNLQHNSSTPTVESILSLFQYHVPYKLNEHDLTLVSLRLLDGDRAIRLAAAKTLCSNDNLPEEILDALVVRLTDEDAGVRGTAFGAFARKLPVKFIESWSARLIDIDGGVRLTAARLLRFHEKLPEKILEALIASFIDGHPDVPEAAAIALSCQQSLPANILEALVVRLTNQDGTIRDLAGHALGRQKCLPENILEDLIAILTTGDFNGRRYAAITLGSQPNLPENIEAALIARLTNKYSRVRRSAVFAFRHRNNLPNKILQHIAERLLDSKILVRREATITLGHQEYLPERILEHLVESIADQRTPVQKSAARALRRDQKLPENILESLLARLIGKDIAVRREGIFSLLFQRILPEKIIDGLVPMTIDQESEIRRVATCTIGFQRNLPENIMDCLAERLMDENDEVRAAAIEGLGRQPTLPDRILRALIERLTDSVGTVRAKADIALGDHANEIIRVGHLFIETIDNPLVLGSVDYTLEKIMLSQPAIYRLMLEKMSLDKIYRLLLGKSYENHIAWYFYEGKLYLETDTSVEAPVPIACTLSGWEARLQEQAGIPPVYLKLESS
jgi:HEAT repeat protein